MNRPSNGACRICRRPFRPYEAIASYENGRKRVCVDTAACLERHTDRTKTYSYLLHPVLCRVIRHVEQHGRWLVGGVDVGQKLLFPGDDYFRHLRHGEIEQLRLAARRALEAERLEAV